MLFASSKPELETHATSVWGHIGSSQACTCIRYSLGHKYHIRGALGRNFWFQAILRREKLLFTMLWLHFQYRAVA